MEMIYENYGVREVQNERIVAIEYIDDQPSSVLTYHDWSHGDKAGTAANYYDFDWCKRDRMSYYRCTGGGPARGYAVSEFSHPMPPPAKLWIAEGIDITDSSLKAAPIDKTSLLAMGYVLIPEPLLLDSGWSEPSANPFESDRCFERTMNQFMPNLGIELHEVPMQTQLVLNTGGHRMRKKRRIRKRFVRRYGYKSVLVRLFPRDKPILQIENKLFGHPQDIAQLRRQFRGSSKEMR